MQIDTFKRIVTTFADPQAPLLFDKSNGVIQVHGDLIEFKIKNSFGEVYVEEADIEQGAVQWILKRLARLPLLADRLTSSVATVKPFIPPQAKVLQTLEVKPNEESALVQNALQATIEAIDNRSALETTILYITSNAGEGKTSLINELAHHQARRFKKNEADWLLVPIPLGGRNFLRFDDIVVGVLANRYRFPHLYYNSFLELVRLGVLVPAFDGFEEMFIENSSGEALSAMGSLVSSLDSQGTAVIAARTAYFEFEDLKSQARLYDTIRSFDVGFGKVALERWNKLQFIAYCNARELPDAEELYEKVVNRLNADHSLVTRPVLVRRLVDIAEKSATLNEFLNRLQVSGGDFFSTFVRGIIEREAADKWLDRSGEISQPIFTVDEHCELLSFVALEMWQSRVDFLKSEMLEFVADYYCEVKRKTALQTSQVRERLKGHPLLIVSTNAQDAVEFDHEEFRQFFLGEAIARLCFTARAVRQDDLLNALRKGILPAHAVSSIVQSFGRANDALRKRGVEMLRDTALLDGQTSFTHENCTTLMLLLISGVETGDIELSNMAFPLNALQDKNLLEVTFKECYFASSRLESTTFQKCRFIDCQFARLDVFESVSVISCELVDCDVEALHLQNRSQSFYEPEQIKFQLRELGFTLSGGAISGQVLKNSVQRHDEIVQFEKLLRYFARSTHMSESVILIKLGGKAQTFLDSRVPELCRAGILVEIPNRGGPDQRRFKLGRPMAAIQRAIEDNSGSYEAWFEAVQANEPPMRDNE